MKKGKISTASLRSSTICNGGGKVPSRRRLSRRSEASALVKLRQHVARAHYEVLLANALAEGLNLSSHTQQHCRKMEAGLAELQKTVERTEIQAPKSANVPISHAVKDSRK